MKSALSHGRRPGHPWVLLVCSFILLVILLSLGTWQVQRLHWKEALLEQIDQRIHSMPVGLARLEEIAAGSEGIEYRPATVSGVFLHAAERHYLATWNGESGFFVYTPLRLEDGRFIFINRGFVPYARKEAATREAGQVKGEVRITGLARAAPAKKPSYMLPDNDPGGNVFYWKDLRAMAATAGLPQGATVVPFYIDADAAPNPGGLPVGGVTLIALPNSHLQYAVTWYGLAAVLAVVVGTLLWRRRKVE